MSELIYKVGERVVQYNGRVLTIFGVNGLELYTVKDDYGKVWFVGINTIDHEATAKLNQPKPPKEMLEDGFRVEYGNGTMRYTLLKLDKFLDGDNNFTTISKYDDNLNHTCDDYLDIFKLYDRQDNLIWQRTEKSAQQIEIERIESTMRDCADRLSKLKGEM